jgi:Flp pilus assembly pilin Flp
MNRLPTVSHPAVDYLLTYLKARVERVRSQQDLSRGASAVEWVIISAVVVTVVGVVAVIINGALKGKATDVGNCISGTTDSKTC